MTDATTDIPDAPDLSNPLRNPPTTPDPVAGPEENPQARRRPETPEEIIETLLTDVRQCETKSLEWRLKAAATYAWARRNLSRTEWRRLFQEKPKRLRIGIREAQMFCRVGDNVGLWRNTSNHPQLPNSIAALCELSVLKPGTISRYCQDHLITPKTTTRQAKALVRQGLAEEAGAVIHTSPVRSV